MYQRYRDRYRDIESHTRVMQSHKQTNRSLMVITTTNFVVKQLGLFAEVVMVPVQVLINFGPLLQVLRVPVVRKMVLVHKVRHNGGTACVEGGERTDYKVHPVIS